MKCHIANHKNAHRQKTTFISLHGKKHKQATKSHCIITNFANAYQAIPNNSHTLHKQDNQTTIIYNDMQSGRKHQNFLPLYISLNANRPLTIL